MAQNPKDNNDWASLPILTEIVGDASPEIPLLTDEAINKQIRAQDDGVLEMSAEEIAALLAPQLEKQLRAKLNAQFEAMWQATWRQTRASLPALIRSQLAPQTGRAAQPGGKGIAGSKQAALDIIAPHATSTGSRKINTGKTSSSKPNIKEPKNK